ncbi:TPA: DUF502 domain-containing protein [Legionella anisa]|uniref:DUF502 domain-containing protein n=1 Tax=Legionella anisa TaxID=28082 RepID=A0AAX0WXZ0_9GAMM|nr:DUF502 domain-containing protein [Legionella anisa]AWN74345.1 DUF502 domain-containing protein [Legionella anisa]MBN5935227.1 DUF502 domain-containing protein [Legionella anisa]MCW8425557.1 DUF502 domain-containing protein [Legionella anisa]MCW8449012.1 DUF502 domain-containing protein [Legionella anisa]PNL61759.1 DUF502 domain-containing protein [Legionella anisa]
MKTMSLRSYLLAGLVVWLPILITIGVLRFIIDLLDNTVALIPKAYQPEQLIGHYIPGIGVILSLIILLITGVIATNYLGQRLVGWGESVLSRIPLVRSIYKTVKQVINAVLSTNSEAFRKVVLIEYPRKGLWTIAFQTGTTNTAINNKTKEEMISVFIPTTPNPTSGFLMMLPRSDVIELDMSIDEALKFIISLGVMPPPSEAALANNL